MVSPAPLRVDKNHRISWSILVWASVSSRAGRVFFLSAGVSLFRRPPRPFWLVRPALSRRARRGTGGPTAAFFFVRPGRCFGPPAPCSVHLLPQSLGRGSSTFLVRSVRSVRFASRPAPCSPLIVVVSLSGTGSVCAAAPPCRRCHRAVAPPLGKCKTSPSRNPPGARRPSPTSQHRTRLCITFLGSCSMVRFIFRSICPASGRLPKPQFPIGTLH